MKKFLTDFGVVQSRIDDDAALTWMRQSHYYIGYTVIPPTLLGLSSLLPAIFIWKMTKMELTVGSPSSNLVENAIETTRIIGADISTDKPLHGWFLSDTVDQIITYSEVGE